MCRRGYGHSRCRQEDLVGILIRRPSHLRERLDFLVRAALRAACERRVAPRRRAAVRAWRESARGEAPEWLSRFNARVVARERFVEERRFAGR